MDKKILLRRIREIQDSVKVNKDDDFQVKVKEILDILIDIVDERI